MNFHPSSHSLTSGSITGSMLRFAFPLMLGNLLQQCYNIADTLIVGRFLGAQALAAVGSAYTLMVFLTSIFIGLCMGSGAVVSLQFGGKNYAGIKQSLLTSLLLIGGITLLINILVILGIHPIIRLLQTPPELEEVMYDYLIVIFLGLPGTFLYNYYAYLLRAVGNSVIPLLFLAVSVVLNFYTLHHFPLFRLQKSDLHYDRKSLREILSFSSLTCIQQSIMNLGILMVQGLVNSFGTGVMAAFATAVKIDSFAYMPVQDFGNAFSTFIAQNFGAGKTERIRKGIRSAVLVTTIFCLLLSVLITGAARPLMQLFVSAQEEEIIRIGMDYLYIEGSFYLGIGYLFLLYGY